MNTPIRALFIMSLLVTYGMIIGMDDEIRKKHKARHEAQRIQELEVERARIKTQLDNLDGAITAVESDPAYQKNKNLAQKAHADLITAQQLFAKAQKNVAEAQDQIDALDAVGRDNLNDEDRVILDNFQSNMATLKNQQTRAEQDLAYQEGMQIDIGKLLAPFEQKLKPLLQQRQEKYTEFMDREQELNKLSPPAVKITVPKKKPIENELKPATKPDYDPVRLQDAILPVVQPSRKPLISRWQSAVLSGAIGAIAAGAFYVGLRWYQKKQISKVVAHHGKMQDDFSAHQRDMMAAAVLASSKIPGSMRYLQWLAGNYNVGSDLIDESLMWHVLADIYWGKAADDQMIQAFKKKVAGSH